MSATSKVGDRIDVCEACGGTRLEPTKYQNVMGTGADLVRCTGCGAKFYDRVVVQTPEEFYDAWPAHDWLQKDEDYGSVFNKDPSVAYVFKDAAIALYNEIIRKLRSLTDPIDTLYDVGAGTGRFLGTARDNGIRNVLGCEPNSRGVALARGRYKIDTVEQAFFRDAINVPAAADAFAMLDMIEHTATPRADLLRVRDHLRPGGVVVVKTFYDEWHEGRELDLTAQGWNRPHGFFGPPAHLWHFDRAVLMVLLLRCGLRTQLVEMDEGNGLVTVYATKAT